jgi:16S rRNA (uracil1498-N3)-methyltransferase
MLLFYAPDILTDNELPQEETQHCMRVLRLSQGDEICITDGKGSFYPAIIDTLSGKRCKVVIKEAIRQEPFRKGYLHIAVAPAKNMERNEWFAEKATEIGIDEISFLNCLFSERKTIKLERINKIVVSAIKQSLKAYLPKVNEMATFEIFIAQNFEGQKFIAHCGEEDKPLLSEIIHKGENVLILIGPEGDFSKDEIRKAMEHGFTPVSLGKSRLRTETAAMVACHTVNLANH